MTMIAAGESRCDTAVVCLALRSLWTHCPGCWPLVTFCDASQQLNEIGHSERVTAAFNGIIRQMRLIWRLVRHIGQRYCHNKLNYSVAHLVVADQRSEAAMTTKPCEQPSEIVAEDGHVLIEAKGSVTLTMTPDAALASADRLADEAVVGTGQRLRSEMPLR